MRTTIIPFIACILFSLQASGAQDNQALIVELPAAQSMDNIIQGISGYLAMQGSSVQFKTNTNTLKGKRVDGIQFEVLFNPKGNHAMVQCQSKTRAVDNRPGQKHRQTGRRFNKTNKQSLKNCTQVLALSVKRAVQ
jgi:hypothetical protein